MEKTLTRLLIVLGLTAAGAAFYYREKIMELIARFEGFSPTPYNDPPGSDKWSIGYGHQIQPGENLAEISVSQARLLLEQDTAKARAAVSQAIKVPLNADQLAALVSFVYNIGTGAFQRGTVPAKLNAGDFQAAADTMRQYNKSGGCINQALIDRREIEASAFDVA